MSYRRPYRLPLSSPPKKGHRSCHSEDSVGLATLSTVACSESFDSVPPREGDAILILGPSKNKQQRRTDHEPAVVNSPANNTTEPSSGRTKKGHCPSCGTKLYNLRRGIPIKGRSSRYIPLTVPGKVEYGRCLVCERSQQEAAASVAATAEDAEVNNRLRSSSVVGREIATTASSVLSGDDSLSALTSVSSGALCGGGYHVIACGEEEAEPQEEATRKEGEELPAGEPTVEDEESSIPELIDERKEDEGREKLELNQLFDWSGVRLPPQAVGDEDEVVVNSGFKPEDRQSSKPVSEEEERKSETRPDTPSRDQEPSKDARRDRHVPRSFHRPSPLMSRNFLRPYLNGDYVGQLNAEHERQGRGMFRWTSGDVYEGTWHRDQPHGSGTYRWTNGDVYTGEYRDGKACGRGVFRWADGDVYEGEWRDDNRDGRGVMRYYAESSDCCGDVYDGEYKKDRMDGWGIYRYANGDVYEGIFRDGEQVEGHHRADKEEDELTEQGSDASLRVVAGWVFDERNDICPSRTRNGNLDMFEYGHTANGGVRIKPRARASTA